jgi:uncharacterized protein (DUF362 family)
MRRREFLAAAGAAAAGCRQRDGGAAARPPSPVVAAKASSYDADLPAIIRAGIEACGLEVRGKRVLLKPNFVEYSREAPINTHPRIVAAALDVFRSLGAAEVRVGEGPGHRRDTWGIAEEAGFTAAIPRFEEIFVDLNRDDVSDAGRFATLPRIWLPNSALAADLVVSLPKMKTHHWAGVTLAMKNYFGLVPGALYGWPKNQLHYLGIPESIAELYRVFPRSFAIVDGIVGMEGDGPILGTPKPAGVLVMGADLVAVDATCARIMGIDPAKLRHLELARRLGNSDPARIEQRGERPESLRSDFALIDQFKHLRLA